MANKAAVLAVSAGLLAGAISADLEAGTRKSAVKKVMTNSEQQRKDALPKNYIRAAPADYWNIIGSYSNMVLVLSRPNTQSSSNLERIMIEDARTKFSNLTIVSCDLTEELEKSLNVKSAPAILIYKNNRIEYRIEGFKFDNESAKGSRELIEIFIPVYFEEYK